MGRFGCDVNIPNKLVGCGIEERLGLSFLLGTKRDSSFHPKQSLSSSAGI